MPEVTTPNPGAGGETQAASFAAESSDCVAVLGRLSDGPATAATIAGDRAIGVARARSAADELRECKLVERLVIDDERAYSITATGELTLFFIETEGER